MRGIATVARWMPDQLGASWQLRQFSGGAVEKSADGASPRNQLRNPSRRAVHGIPFKIQLVNVCDYAVDGHIKASTSAAELAALGTTRNSRDGCGRRSVVGRLLGWHIVLMFVTLGAGK